MIIYVDYKKNIFSFLKIEGGGGGGAGGGGGGGYYPKNGRKPFYLTHLNRELMQEFLVRDHSPAVCLSGIFLHFRCRLTDSS